jgi:hypothetical protein
VGLARDDAAGIDVARYGSVHPGGVTPVQSVGHVVGTLFSSRSSPAAVGGASMEQ